MKKIAFKLFDKENNHIGNEIHEPNEWGVIQIYHETLRDDWKDGYSPKQLVREGYFIPHFYKTIISHI